MSEPKTVIITATKAKSNGKNFIFTGNYQHDKKSFKSFNKKFLRKTIKEIFFEN